MTPASDSSALTSSDVKSAFTALSTSNTATTSPWLFLMGTTTSLRLAELHATCPGKASTSGTSTVSLDSHAAAHTPFPRNNRVHATGLGMGPRPNCLDARRRGKSPPSANWKPTSSPTLHSPSLPTRTIPPPTAQTTWARVPPGETHAASSCRWEGIPPWAKSTFPEPSNRHLVRNQAKASHTPPSTLWPAAVRDFWQARNVAPVVSTSSTKTTAWPQATVSLDTDSNIPSSASNRSPRVASVKEDRCRIRRNVVDDMSRFHTLASPAHNASDGLNPLRHTRRQWDGTGINVVFSGGGRHRLPIHMPSVLPCLGNPPYFMR